MSNGSNLSKACRTAAEALQILSNVNSTGILDRIETNNPISASIPNRMSNVFVPSTSNSSLEQELAERFPTVNATRSRKRKSNSPALTSHRNNKKAQRGRRCNDVVFKDLVFIPDPKETEVPTHKKRLVLEEQNFVIHEFPFKRSWSAETLKEEVGKVLPNGIEFEFVKACYGTLVKPNLANGVEVTTNVLIKMAGQGNIYVRSITEMDDSDNENTDEILMHPSFATTCCISTVATASGDDNVSIDTPNQGSSGDSASLTQRSSNWVDDDVAITENSLDNVLTSNEVTSFNDSERFLEHDAPAVSPTCEIVLDDRHFPVPFEDDPISIISVEDHQTPMMPPPHDSDPFIIKVHRTMIRKDLIKIFSDDSVMSQPLFGIIINAKGEEEVGRGTGVMREIFTLFWSEFADSSLIGEEERVPFIRHDYNKETWQAIARILVKGFKDCSYCPLQLSRAFIGSVFFDEAFVTVPMLLTSFKRYVSKDEAGIVEQALSKEIPLDSKELEDFLSNFDCRRVVTLDNISDIIQELAHKELIQRPKYVSDCWADIVSQLKLYFPTIDDLVEFYKSREPTNAKVVNMLHADITNDAEREAFNHLKKYVRGLEKSKLCAFLRFITASDILVTDEIKVSFSKITGAARRPVSHTCGCTLELPSTYANFCELREEFSSILSADSWEMNIV